MSRPAATVDVQVHGTAVCVDDTQALLERAIDLDAERVRAERDKPHRASQTVSPVAQLLEPRFSRPEPPRPLEEVIASRAATFWKRWPECVRVLLAVTAPRVSIQVTNTSDHYLTDPELRITLPATACVKALRYSDIDEHELYPWPPPPRDGYQPLTKAQMRGYKPQGGNCPVEWTKDTNPCVITVKPAGLPPGTPRTANIELVLQSLDPEIDVIPVHWTLVSPNLTGHLNGTLELPVQRPTTEHLYERGRSGPDPD